MLACKPAAEVSQAPKGDLTLLLGLRDPPGWKVCGAANLFTPPLNGFVSKMLKSISRESNCTTSLENSTHFEAFLLENPCLPLTHTPLVVV